MIHGKVTVGGGCTGMIRCGRDTAAQGAHILPLHALCDRDLQQRSMSRPGTACRPRPSSSWLLPRMRPSLSSVGHPPLRLPVTRLTAVHARICVCLKCASQPRTALCLAYRGCRRIRESSAARCNWRRLPHQQGYIFRVCKAML